MLDYLQRMCWQIEQTEHFHLSIPTTVMLFNDNEHMEVDSDHDVSVMLVMTHCNPKWRKYK